MTPQDRHCKGLRELLLAEQPALKSAVGHRRYLISKREHKENPKDVDWDSAKSEFFDTYGNAWMEGYKMAYCNHCCAYRNACELKDLELNKWLAYAE